MSELSCFVKKSAPKRMIAFRGVRDIKKRKVFVQYLNIR